jgi:hypothetical protein
MKAKATFEIIVTFDNFSAADEAQRGEGGGERLGHTQAASHRDPSGCSSQ